MTVLEDEIMDDANAIISGMSVAENLFSLDLPDVVVEEVKSLDPAAANKIESGEGGEQTAAAAGTGTPSAGSSTTPAGKSFPATRLTTRNGRSPTQLIHESVLRMRGFEPWQQEQVQELKDKRSEEGTREEASQQKSSRPRPPSLWSTLTGIEFGKD